MGGQRKTQWCKRKHVSPSLLKAWKRSLAGQLRKRDSSADASRQQPQERAMELLYLTSNFPNDRSSSRRRCAPKQEDRSCCLGEHCTGGTSILTAAFQVPWAEGAPRQWPVGFSNVIELNTYTIL